MNHRFSNKIIRANPGLRLRPINLNLVGDQKVGKTTWAHFLQNGDYIKNYVASAKISTYYIKDTNLKRVFCIFDYPGNDSMDIIKLNRFKLDVAVIMCDLTNIPSCKHVYNWYRYIRERFDSTTPIIVVANKVGLVRSGSQSTLKAILKKIEHKDGTKLPLYQISCKLSSVQKDRKLFIPLNSFL